MPLQYNEIKVLCPRAPEILKYAGFFVYFVKQNFRYSRRNTMGKNVGKNDKTIRLIAAIVIAILILLGVLTGVWAWILGIIAVFLALTSAISFCPVYRVLGISTCPTKEKEPGKDKETK
jgi:cobalamin synthase